MLRSFFLTLLIVACLPLAADSTESDVFMFDPIALVKAAASRLSSPPRLYRTSGEAVFLWPDQQGATSVQGFGGGGIDAPMQHPDGLERSQGFERQASVPPTYELTTLTDSCSDPGATAIQLALRWTLAAQSYQHSWLFHVSGDEVRFIRESGDPLPDLPV